MRKVKKHTGIAITLPDNESGELFEELRAWANANGLKMGRAYYEALKRGMESLKTGYSNDKIVPY